MDSLVNISGISLLTPALISALLGLLLLLLGISRIRNRRIIAGGMGGLLAILFLSLGVILLLGGINLHTYQRLTYETAIARIEFHQSAPQQFLAVLQIAGQESGHSYKLTGDEWQIDARILKWRAPAILAGLDVRYRLERLSGRYRSIEQERTGPRSVFALSVDPGLNLWRMLGKLQSWIDWVDTWYGNSVYMPMTDRAEFEVILTQSGILARPVNDIARRALRNWN